MKKIAVSILIPYQMFERLVNEKCRQQTTLSRVILDAIEIYFSKERE